MGEEALPGGLFLLVDRPVLQGDPDQGGRFGGKASLSLNGRTTNDTG